jgi:hypothetical protein
MAAGLLTPQRCPQGSTGSLPIYPYPAPLGRPKREGFCAASLRRKGRRGVPLGSLHSHRERKLSEGFPREWVLRECCGSFWGLFFVVSLDWWHSMGSALLSATLLIPFLRVMTEETEDGTSTPRSSRWSRREDDLIRQAVKDRLGDSVNWTSVAEAVGTRSASSCCEKRRKESFLAGMIFQAPNVRFFV